MNYIAECLEKFQSLPTGIREKLGGDEAYQKIKKLEKEFDVSLSFYLILLIINELDFNNGPDYLVAKFSITKKKAKDITDRLYEVLIYPAFDAEIGPSLDSFIDVLADEVAVPEIIKYNAAQVEDIFDSQLIPTLLQDEKTIQAFNISAFAAMDVDDLLEDRLINLLLNNEELISASNVIVDGRSYRGTVKNWLKDFISYHGSDIFDTFILAKYINFLDNKVSLNPGEKKILTKVLKTYRNLIFFPDSMDKVPIESWAILPFEAETVKQKVAELQGVISSKAGIKKEQSDVNEDNFKPNLSDVANIKIVLQNMLSDYSRDSLEYKAIKEEIGRLDKKK
jgi:hypothetical protein